jgi:cytochrome c551/c552
MPRELVWIENPNFQGFGCSGCTWVFDASGALVGESLDEMKQKYEGQRDREFAAHLCADHPRATRKKSE